MSSIQHFEEIEAWQLGRRLARPVYECSAVGRFANDRALQGQIRRATVSIVSNIAEGFERGGSAEFAQFLAVAKGSTGYLKRSPLKGRKFVKQSLDTRDPGPSPPRDL